MRRLLYVPILHAPEDLGSLAEAVRERTIALCGEARWRRHEETVRLFWRGVSEHLLALDAAGLHLYQDGLAAEGEVGGRVVEAAARLGSPNYSLLRELMRRGAILHRTEDPIHLLAERQGLLLALGATERAPEGRGAGARPRTSPGRPADPLLTARDRTISTAINETLPSGGRGVLFLGAYHDLLAFLAPDIAVDAVKDLGIARAYARTFMRACEEGRWQPLAQHMAGPVVVTPMGRARKGRGSGPGPGAA